MRIFNIKNNLRKTNNFTQITVLAIKKLKQLFFQPRVSLLIQNIRIKENLISFILFPKCFTIKNLGFRNEFSFSVGNIILSASAEGIAPQKPVSSQKYPYYNSPFVYSFVGVRGAGGSEPAGRGRLHPRKIFSVKGYWKKEYLPYKLVQNPHGSSLFSSLGSKRLTHLGSAQISISSFSSCFTISAYT